MPIVLIIVLLAATFFWAFAAQTPPVKRLPLPALNGTAPLHANGAYVVSVRRQGHWREVAKLGYDMVLRQRQLDLAPLPLVRGKAYTFKLEARNAAGILLGVSAEISI